MGSNPTPCIFVTEIFSQFPVNRHVFDTNHGNFTQESIYTGENGLTGIRTEHRFHRSGKHGESYGIESS